MDLVFSTKAVAAALAGCKEEDLLVFRMTEDGSAVVVKANGQKYTYSPQQLDKQAQLMNLDNNKLPKEENKLLLSPKTVAGTVIRKKRSKK